MFERLQFFYPTTTRRDLGRTVTTWTRAYAIQARPMPLLTGAVADEDDVRATIEQSRWQIRRPIGPLQPAPNWRILAEDGLQYVIQAVAPPARIDGGRGTRRHYLDIRAKASTDRVALVIPEIPVEPPSMTDIPDGTGRKNKLRWDPTAAEWIATSADMATYIALTRMGTGAALKEALDYLLANAGASHPAFFSGPSALTFSASEGVEFALNQIMNVWLADGDAYAWMVAPAGTGDEWQASWNSGGIEQLAPALAGGANQARFLTIGGDTYDAKVWRMPNDNRPGSTVASLQFYRERAATDLAVAVL